jgi:hypothetical protein
MQLCLSYVRRHESLRGTTYRYIYISVSHRRIDAVRRKRAGAILNATEMLWPHDVRICVAIRKIPFSQAVLPHLSFSINSLEAERKDYIAFVQRREKSPGYL